MKSARVAAVLEIAGLYMTGQLLAFLLLLMLGIDVKNPLEVLRADPHADLLALSWSLATLLTAQYGITFLLVFLVGKWHRHRPLSAYGFQPTGTLGSQLVTGVVLFALAELPLKLMTAWDSMASWGPKAFTQEFVYAQDWSDYRFWIFTAVGSFLLIPVVEELFFRGYVQTRLAEDFSPLAAIVGTAVFFQFSHGQYLEAATPWNVGTMVVGLNSAFLWGVVFFHTRSVLVTVVAHTLVNIPVRGVADLLLPLAMVALLVLSRHQVAQTAKEVISRLREHPTPWVTAALALGLLGFALAVTLASDVALAAGAAALFVAVILHALSKRNPSTSRREK